jgi:predicted phosphoadenosine phosphosulfate sulfurtransferase
MSGKTYLNKNVYEAFVERMDYIFAEFDNIIVAFSGGKDSGLLLNLTLDYIARNKIKKRPCLFHQDFEAQYEKTTEYVSMMFERCEGIMDLHWSCVPMAVRTAVGNFESWWYPWDDQKQELWVREMPDYPYVCNLNNNPMGDYYRYRMDYNSHAKQFSRWFHRERGGGKTISLLGLRADESLNRYSAIVNKRLDYKGKKWITTDFKDIYSASPIYDWTVSDVWHANAIHDYPYNKLYDLYYKAGVSVDDMRVASPFNDEAKNSLNLYRVLEPQTWTKLVGRVQGANFAAIYGGTKAIGYREVSLPEGHTWKSYVKFLLATLPDDLRRRYVEKFKTSIRFWHKTGGGFSNDVIQEIEDCKYEIERNGVSNYSKDGKSKIIFHGPMPDDTDDVKSTIDIPSWKRMAFCILKNDHMCKHMGFGLTHQQNERRKEILAKYASL